MTGTACFFSVLYIYSATIYWYVHRNTPNLWCNEGRVMRSGQRAQCLNWTVANLVCFSTHQSSKLRRTDSTFIQWNHGSSPQDESWAPSALVGRSLFSKKKSVLLFLKGIENISSVMLQGALPFCHLHAMVSHGICRGGNTVYIYIHY